MTTTHTPGPWLIGDESGADCSVPIYVTDPDGVEDYCVCSVCWFDGFPPGERGEANARLIAAAPELLAVCESLLEATQGPALTFFSLDNARHLLRSVVAKARGK